jgi:pSer/pThr/pTyr-binding forkhead associated (FHA) protein
MAFRLEVNGESAREGTRTVVVSGHKAAIGRGRECALRLDEVGISHHHATAYHCGQSFLVVDEGSANGTFVGETMLGARAARVVQPGESVRVGRIRIDVCIDERAAPPADANTRDLALAMVNDMTSGTNGDRATPWIAVIAGPDAGKALLLSEEDKPYFIGRGSSVDLALEDERVSRRQLSVSRRGREVFIRSLARNDRASLEDQALAEDVALRWMPGTSLKIARSALGLFDPVHELERKLDPTGQRARITPPNITAVAPSAPIAPLPSPSAAPAEVLPVRRRWSAMDASIVIIASLAIAGGVAILIWLIVPWST